MTTPTDSQSRRHILVVEDDALLGMLMQDLLEELGCECVGPASNLADALESARADNFDAAILDLALGRDTAYPVAKLLAERGIPFAFATGLGRESLESEWTGQACIGKPYVLDDIQRLLDELLPR